MPKFFTHAGRAVPALVTDRAIEDAASRNRAAFLTLPWRSTLIIEGRDAASFLHAMLTQDIETMEVGEVRPAYQVDRKGHVIADLWVHREGDRFSFDLQSDLISSVQENLERYLVTEDVRITVPEAVSIVLLLGPEAPEILRSSALSAWPVRETAGPDFHLITDDLDALIRLLREAGAQEIGGETLNRLRIEAGRPWFGRDFDRKSFPMELGLEEAISSSKGCYIGQETIVRVRDRGKLKRSLYGIRIPGEPPEEGSVVEEAGEALATILSVAGPVGEGGDSLALLLLRREDQSPGRQVQVAARTGRLEPLPFREAAHD